MKIGLTVSYDGTAYSGWQIQPNVLTVQELIQNAIKTVTNEMVTVTGSGRTDAGVHALGQFAHFVSKSNVPCEKFAKAINAYLPPDVKVTKSQILPDDFHAVKSAKKKTYKYVVYTGETEEPLTDRYAFFVPQKLDVKTMKKCAKLFVGDHDFKGFSASGGGAKTSVRKIYSVKINRIGKRIEIVVTGNGFLYKMVRMIAGAIVLAGQGKFEKTEIIDALANGTVLKNRQTLPAKGLCLVGVEYDCLKK